MTGQGTTQVNVRTTALDLSEEDGDVSMQKCDLDITVNPAVTSSANVLTVANIVRGVLYYDVGKTAARKRIQAHCS